MTTDNTKYEYECDDCYWGGDPQCYFVQVNDYRRVMFTADNIKKIDKIDLEAREKEKANET